MVRNNSLVNIANKLHILAQTQYIRPLNELVSSNWANAEKKGTEEGVRLSKFDGNIRNRKKKLFNVRVKIHLVVN